MNTTVKPTQPLMRPAVSPSLACLAVLVGMVLSACQQSSVPAGRLTPAVFPLTIDCEVERKEIDPDGKVSVSQKTERFSLSQQQRAGLMGPKQAWISVSDIDGVKGDAPAQPIWVLVRAGADELTERRVHHTLWDGQQINEYTHIDVTDEFIKVKNSIGYPRDQHARERDLLVISRIDGSLVERWTIATAEGVAHYEDLGECYLPGHKPPKPAVKSPTGEHSSESTATAGGNGAQTEINKAEAQTEAMPDSEPASAAAKMPAHTSSPTKNTHPE